MKLRRLVVLLVLVSTGYAAVAAASYAGDPLDTPVRLAQLSRLDSEVKVVVHAHWRRGIFTGRWRGNPFIVVSRSASLLDVQRAAPNLLRRLGATWQLRSPLFVVLGATLSLSSPSVRRLQLVTLARSYATIVAYDSNLRITGSRTARIAVSSWDARAGGPDLDLDDGRGSVSVRGVGRLDASYADFSYLGFARGRVSGVAVNGFDAAAKGSGRVDHSSFSHNVYGAYTWEAQRMRWTRDSFTQNMVYGFDPHDASNWFVVDHNYAAYNARHGIIFSRKCWHDVIRDNVSAHNGWHGIVVDDGRNGKIAPSGDVDIYGNVVRDNAKVGISIDGSNRNIVRGNRISGGRVGIRVFGRAYGVAERNELIGNHISGASETGILVQRPASWTRLVDDRITGSVVGIALHGSRATSITDSTVEQARLHAVTIVDAPPHLIARNMFSGSGPSVIERIGGPADLPLRDNVNHWDYPLVHDVARAMSWVVGPGLWALLLIATLISGRLARLVRRGSAAGAATAQRRRERTEDESCAALSGGLFDDAGSAASACRAAEMGRDAASVEAAATSTGRAAIGHAVRSALGIGLGILTWRRRTAVWTLIAVLIRTAREHEL